MLGFLLYLPTLYGVSHIAFIAAAVFAILFRRDFRLRLNHDIFLILGLIIISLIIRLWGIDNIYPVEFDKLPWFLGIIITYVLAINLKDNDVKVIIYLTAAECFIVVIQFVLGIKSFWGNTNSYYINTGLLYYSAPDGLSTNSSIVAVKILLALLLTYKIKINKYHKTIVILLYFAGLVLTFNRSAILSVMVFYILTAFTGMIKKSLLPRTIYAIMTILVAFVVYLYFDQLTYQLLRGQNTIGLSGRDDIWISSCQFIKSNIWFGNSTFKYYSYAYAGIKEHLHNSYLELIATSGIFVLSGYLFLIIKNIRKSNAIPVFMIMLFSFAQYGIFWGISILDVGFFYLLFSKPRK